MGWLFSAIFIVFVAPNLGLHGSVWFWLPLLFFFMMSKRSHSMRCAPGMVGRRGKWRHYANKWDHGDWQNNWDEKPKRKRKVVETADGEYLEVIDEPRHV